MSGWTARDPASLPRPVGARADPRSRAIRIDAYPHEFSGGMRQRIMLASVMLLKPKLLIADEPTTALDTLTQRDVLDLMVGLARDHGTSVLLITHISDWCRAMRSAHWYCARARCVEAGTTRKILLSPSEAYTKRLVEALPRRGATTKARQGGEPLVSVRGLRSASAGGKGCSVVMPRAAVNGVELDIAMGETVAVVGGSGSGKTTLGRAMLRLIPTSVGDQIPGQGCDDRGDRDFRLASQLVFQDPYSSLDPRMRVGEIVAEPLRHVPQLAAANAIDVWRRCWRKWGLRASANAGRTRPVRRSAAADRDRARDRAPASLRGRGRAGLGARHDHPGAGAEIAGAAPAAIWLRLPVHQP